MAKERIRLSAIIPASPERVYLAWMSSEEHTAFTGAKADMDPVVGGRFHAWDKYIQGLNVELDPGKRFVQMWRTTEFPKGHGDSRLEVQLERVGSSARITVMHSDIPEGQGAKYKSGWETKYFQPLRAYFLARGHLESVWPPRVVSPSQAPPPPPPKGAAKGGPAKAGPKGGPVKAAPPPPKSAPAKVAKSAAKGPAKPAPAKPTAKPAAKPAATKPAARSAPAKSMAKPAAKPAPAKPMAKPAAKPAPAKPVAKPAAKPAPKAPAKGGKAPAKPASKGKASAGKGTRGR